MSHLELGRLSRLNKATVFNLDFLDGGILEASLGGLDGLDDVLTGNDLAKDDVTTVEVRSGNRGDEELGAVGVGAGVGHGKQVGAGVAELEVFIGELVAVDGNTATAVEVGEVTSLNHKVLDDAVEIRTLVVEREATCHALLTSAKSTEVGSSLGHNLIKELRRVHTNKVDDQTRIGRERKVVCNVSGDQRCGA